MCARYFGDQNQSAFYYESGTYANISGGAHWIGMVTDHSPDEQENINRTRYQGTDSRNVSKFHKGPRDFDGTINYHPQDWKLLGYALGSIVDGGSPSPYTHTLKELDNRDLNPWTSGTRNPFPSLGFEVAQQAAGTGQNFLRNVRGAVVNVWTLQADQGEPISVDVNYMAQNITNSSGAKASVTEASTRSYLWDDLSIEVPSGTSVENLKSLTFSVNNNLDRRHYMNGSVVAAEPAPQNRDYTLDLTVDGNSEQTKTFYQQYFQGGSTFNAMLNVIAEAGSRQIHITLSGCRLVDMDAPNPVEGTDEQTINIEPQSVSAVVDDTIELYAPW